MHLKHKELKKSYDINQVLNPQYLLKLKNREKNPVKYNKYKKR